MRVERIDVLAHAREPVGSFAIIKLFGINRLDGPATFRLEPISDTAPRPLGWPDGDLRPIGVRAGNGTVELLVGPEITRSGALVKGTAVRFRMPSAEADMTLEWPDLTDHAPVDQPLGEAARSMVPHSPSRVASKPASSPSPKRSANGARPPEQPVDTEGLARLQRRGPAAAPPITDIAKPPPQPTVASAGSEGRAATVPPPAANASVPGTPSRPPATAPLDGSAPPPRQTGEAVAKPPMPPAVLPSQRRPATPPPIPTGVTAGALTDGPTDIVATVPPPSPAAARSANGTAAEPPAAVVPTALPPTTPPRASISLVPFTLGLVIVAAMLVTFLRTTTIEGSSTTLYGALLNADAGRAATTAPSRSPNEVLL